LQNFWDSPQNSSEGNSTLASVPVGKNDHPLILGICIFSHSALSTAEELQTN